MRTTGLFCAKSGSLRVVPGSPGEPRLYLWSLVPRGPWLLVHCRIDPRLSALVSTFGGSAFGGSTFGGSAIRARSTALARHDLLDPLAHEVGLDIEALAHLGGTEVGG